MRIPKALLRFVTAMAQRIKRLVALWLLEIRGGRSHAIDRIDLRGHLTVLIRDDPVFCLRLRYPNRLGRALKKIHDWRAAKLKRIGVDALFQRPEPMLVAELAQRNQNLER